MKFAPRKSGFTLIELVVVIAIIAALAGLVIPQVSMLGRTTDMASSASSQAELTNNLQLYFVLQKRYPQGLDSLLLDTNGAGGIYNPNTTDPNTQTSGLPYSGADSCILASAGGVAAADAAKAMLSVDTLTNATGAEYLRSFTRCGFDVIYDHDAAVINSNNSGTIARALTGSSHAVARITGQRLIDKLCPQGLAPTEKLIALGIGPKNYALGKTITNCPIYNGCDGKYYGRYIAVFKVYASGERAVLVGVMDSYSRTPDYTQQQYNESLPDGARQG